VPNKTTEMYKELFGCLRSALIDKFGNVGAMKYAVLDFERAALNAIGDVFPEVKAKGCIFHYRQALMRRIQQEGLKAVYESTTDYPTATHDYGNSLRAAYRFFYRPRDF